ncbi:MAG TPA: hypothetical protein VGQ76_09740 [Thermoanaerobaculia bacterium]|jgi:hypothetical protein|nr:hypothetical protein [Thermoanaerobaculia bacterium]
MTSYPPPQPQFTVRGADGHDYPADLPTLREWVRTRQVVPSQQVYSSTTGQWSRIGDVPALRDLVASSGGLTKGVVFGSVGIGCVVLIALLVVAAIIGQYLVTTSRRPEARRTAVTAKTAQTAATQVPHESLTPAQRRLAAAAELQRTFDSSDLKGFELKFAVRGRNCDLLHVQGDVNLYPEMMEALGYGTVEYGRILPGGVNKHAFDAGFRDVVYTNPSNTKSKSFGGSSVTPKQARTAPLCTEAIAARLDPSSEKPVARPKEPRFEQLSWANARVGQRLYDGSYKHEATITSLDRTSDRMRVRYVKSGTVEPKQFSAVAQYWYVKE